MCFLCFYADQAFATMQRIAFKRMTYYPFNLHTADVSALKCMEYCSSMPTKCFLLWKQTSPQNLEHGNSTWFATDMTDMCLHHRIINAHSSASFCSTLSMSIGCRSGHSHSQSAACLPNYSANWLSLLEVLGIEKAKKAWLPWLLHTKVCTLRRCTIQGYVCPQGEIFEVTWTNN